MVLSDQEMPTVYIVKDLKGGTKDTPITTVYVDAGDGEVEVGAEYFSKDALIFDEDSQTEIILVAPETFDKDAQVDMSIEDTSFAGYDLAVDIFESYTYAKAIDLPSDLFLQSALTFGSHDSKTHYRINLGTVATSRDTNVDLSLASARYFDVLSDVFCVASGTLYSILGDIRYQTGTIWGVSADIYTVASGFENIDVDLYTSNQALTSVVADIQRAFGRCASYYTDVYSARLETGLIGADLKTRSLFLDGFFLNIDEFTAASGVGYVDIVDYIYEINNETIQITKDDTTISGIVIEDIPNGRRVYFDPLDDFYSDGELVISVYAESVYGEVLEEDFYLLYGYNIELDEDGVVWDAATRVYVSATASNAVVCNNVEGAHYYFDTMDYFSFNLGAYINPVESRDLGFSIYPQSTAFYYGQTYTVTVSGVRDYHGNQMEPFTYTFTIESP
jgi:hypothetical protein